MFVRAALGQSRTRVLQEPHEDGHLLSFIKPTREGLVLVRGRDLEPVRLLSSEIAVLSGSLLSELSDFAIPSAYHAVLAPSEPTKRVSLMYFVNPERGEPATSFMRRRNVDLDRLCNLNHVGFGNAQIHGHENELSAAL